MNHEYINKRIDEIDSQIAKINSRIKEINKELLAKEKLLEYLQGEEERIASFKYFDKISSFMFVRELTSMMENKDYRVRFKEIYLYQIGDYETSYILKKYNYIFLVDEYSEKKAMKEIQRQFVLEGSSEVEKMKVKETSLMNSSKFLIGVPELVSDNFIQLACSEVETSNLITYEPKDKNLKFDLNTTSLICDERYSYIYDYMDQLLEYKINYNSKPSLSDAINLACKFVKEYQTDFPKNQDKVLLKKNRNS